MQRREHELITHCVRTHITDQRLEAIEHLMTQSLDWSYLIKLLEHNCVTSLFAYNIRHVPLASTKPILNEYFAGKLLQTTAHNLKLESELLRILQSCQAHKVRAIPFKGPTLAEIVYGNIALRHISDLDILIDRQQYPAVCELLVSLGYQRLYTLSIPNTEPFRESYVDLFKHSENGIQLDLHWQLAEIWRSVLAEPQGLWNYTVPTKFNGIEIEVFCIEFLFVYLCVHGYRHCWGRLKWLSDIAELIDCRPDLDWEKVDALTRKFAVADVVDMAMLLAKDILDAQLPPDAAQRVASKSKLLKLEPYVLQTLFPQGQGFWPSDLPSGKRFFFQFQLASPAQKLRLLKRRYFETKRWIPNQADRDWVHLPKWIDFLYYFIRPLRLVYRYGREQLELVRSIVERS